MSNPWDKELTPLVDSNAGYYEGNRWVQSKSGDEVDSSFARRLERRLRHAEKLLELSVKTHGLGFVTGKMTKHLEAAKAEDNP